MPASFLSVVLPPGCDPWSVHGRLSFASLADARRFCDALDRALTLSGAGRATGTFGPTRQQKRVLEIITAARARDGISPSYEDIRAELGIASKASVHRMVKGLIARGLLRQLPRTARSLVPAGEAP